MDNAIYYKPRKGENFSYEQFRSSNEHKTIHSPSMIIIFLVRSCGFFNESIHPSNSSINWSLARGEIYRILSWSWKDFDQSSPCRDDYDRAESTIMQITALDRVTQRHVLLVEDIDCAVLSILRCPMSSSILLWLLVSMTFSASCFTSWLGLLRDRVSRKKKKNTNNILSQSIAAIFHNILKDYNEASYSIEYFIQREVNKLER